ncbi:Vitamin K-dependent gamma-carboxylase [Clavibacter michiganensis]|uniref:Vitamin K-dependent gamma-carboxylase n=1 Tax=Clavibacter michiganensis TaxID=28447 RepID=A0A251YBU8_9MICO|nr:HTTM domain-containing protein [Clavibacter michiganensis]OUE21716.1 Vitamin K-dependent gamma-carboxylase [Clavibacter michiganensis]
MSARTHEPTATPKAVAAGSWAGRSRTVRPVPSARAARVRRLLQDRELLTALRDPRGWPRGIATWMTEREHATFSFAALRIMLGAVILMVLVTCFADRHYLWGVGSRFIDPEASRRGWLPIFTGLFSKTDATLFDLAYLVLVVLAALFTLGWRTRIVTPFLLLFWIGLSTNSTLLTNGGDTVLRLTLFFVLFADLSRHLSLDAVRRRREREAAEAGIVRRTPARHVEAARTAVDRIPRLVRVLLHNTALVLCAYQIMLVYVNSAILKLQGPEWRDGSATYYSLLIEGYRPWPWLSDLVAQASVGVVLASFVAVAFQGLFPLLILWRPTRVVALVVITGMHLMIGILLGLWPFSLAMIALDFLFIRDATWREGLALARRVRAEAPGRIRELHARRSSPAAPAEVPAET